MFVSGLVLLAEETLRGEPRDVLLLVASALIGVPVSTIADRATRRGPDK